MNEKRLAEILSQVGAVRVAVVGDFFLDRYWEVAPELDEPSIETGLTAYQVVRGWSSPGAAGTVVNNLATLGVGKIFAVGFLGKDGEGHELANRLDEIGVDRTFLFETETRATPCYTKPLRGGVEMNRFDIKNRTETSKGVEDELIKSILAVADRVDALIVMDQVSEENCGVLTERVREALTRLGGEHPELLIYADSRERIRRYRDMIVKCNERELLEAFDVPFGTAADLNAIRQYGTKMAARTGRAVFVTLGERGQLVVAPPENRTETTLVPAVRVEGEIDICGAGDASSSAIVTALCVGADYEEAAMLGNLASSVTIRKIGRTGTATPREILAAFEQV